MLSVTNLAGFGAGAVDEVQQWYTGLTAAGGTLASDSLDIARKFISELKRKSYSRNILSIYPFLGSNIAAGIMPLRDILRIGIPTNTGFVNGDFSQSTGLQGATSGKILNLKIKPNQLGGANGGMFYWETNIAFTGSAVAPMGCYGGTGYFVIELRSGSRRAAWGLPANYATTGTGAGVNGFYYMRRALATDLKLYENSVQIAANTTSDPSSGNGTTEIRLMGAYDPADAVSFPTGYKWAGRCAVAGLTTGAESAADMTDFQTLLQDYLLTPTGR